jgi:hypothetical protein
MKGAGVRVGNHGRIYVGEQLTSACRQMGISTSVEMPARAPLGLRASAP